MLLPSLSVYAVALLEAALAPDKDGKGKEDKFLVQTVVESECIEALPAVVAVADEAALVKERVSQHPPFLLCCGVYLPHT